MFEPCDIGIEVQIEEKRIEAVKTLSEPKSVRDIQAFMSFINFYWRFIKNIIKIAILLTSMLKTIAQTSFTGFPISNMVRL